MTLFAPDSLRLNRKLPLWYQVSQSLRASILGRAPDAPLRLPTEEQLAGHYGVSVLTMRQALKELETEGLISRHRRRGTFIEPSARQGTPIRLLGSVDAIVAQQSGMRTVVLGHGPVPVPGELAGYFPDLPEAMSFRRLRHDLHTDEPTNWAENLVRPELAASIDLADLRRWPMTKVLRDTVGVRISRITDTVEARLADPETARLLRVPLLSPILHYTGVTYDERERAVDVVRIRYRGDCFAFSVTVEADTAGAADSEPGGAGPGGTDGAGADGTGTNGAGAGTAGTGIADAAAESARASAAGSGGRETGARETG